jgi:uncharacterized tellurite resistance protein B-like protein
MEQIERWKCAFLYHFTQEVVLADQRLHKQEIHALLSLNAEMVAAGLMSPDGSLLEVYEPTRDTALVELQGSLSEPDRRALVERLRPVVMVDGTADPAELAALQSAATALGLT